jgi:hypothetical protein
MGFAAIGFWPAIFHGQNVRSWALALSTLLAALALVWPPALKSFYRVWMMIGEVLGAINTRIILGLVYYAAIVPIGAIRRMSGKDPMLLKFDSDAKTYKSPRPKRPASHMQRQY